MFSDDHKLRPYPPPQTPWLFAQTWHDTLFAHYPVEQELVRRLLPPPLTLETYEGQGWISVVAFGVKHFRPRGLPPVPGISAFPEVNLRTYCSFGGKPGIYIFTLDVKSPLTVIGARLLFYLAYYRARMSLRREGSRIAFSSERLRRDFPGTFIADYTPIGDVSPPQPGTLAYWLAQRFCVYSLDRRQRVYRSEVDHAPWPLQAVEAVIRENTLGTSLGLPLPDAALMQYAVRVDVKLWFRTKAETSA